MGVGARTFQSAGQISQHVIPGAYSRIDSVKGAAGLASANNGVIMGQCKGGEPATLLQFNTVAEAVNALRSGPLMEAVRLSFNPGNDLVPQKLFAMRVNTAVQSSLELEKGVNSMIELTSLDYGLWTNQIKVKVETGGSYGKKVTITYQSQTPEVFDDVRRQSFTIQNTFGATAMTIVNNSGAQTLTTTGTPALNIDLNDYPTIGELAAYINDQTNFTCTPIAGQENAATLELDGIASQDINTSAYTSESTMEAIIDTINAGSVYISAAADNAANDRGIPDNLAETYMTGGSEGTYSATEWTAALVQLEAENIQFVASPDDSASVHGSIKSHCVSMSSVTGRKERQFLLGAPWKTSTVATEITNAKSAAATLNSKYGKYVLNGGTQYDVNGTLANYSGAYAGCMLLGMACATAINMPLTFKTLNFVELEWKFSDSQLEDLIKNGVCPINYNETGVPHCVRQIQTYLTDDLKWNEFSMAKEMLFCSRDLRGYLEKLFVGNPGLLTPGVLKGAVEARLDLYKELGILITNPETGLAWWNVVITISGDVVYVDYDAYLTAPINFIFCTNHFHELVAVAA